MSARLTTDRMVIATHNRGKLDEFRSLLKGYVETIVAAGDLGLPEPDETGTSFAENALIKARAAAQASGCLSLADDSGLCVVALDNRPGIYTARWAGPDKNFPAAMQRLNDEVADHPDRRAFFICALALAWPDGRSEIFEGRIDGTLAPAPRGTGGHGYDPIFIPEGETRSFAEMAEAEKNAISHRGRAAAALKAYLSEH